MAIEGPEDKLKIFLVAYWHDPRWRGFEGAAVKIWDLARNLSHMGHPVTLFLPRGRFAVEDTNFSLAEIPFFDIPFLRSISFSLFLLYQLAKRNMAEGPDLIYMRRMNSLLPAWFAKRKGCLFFLEVNDDPFRRDFQEGSKIVFRLRAGLDSKIDELNLKACDRAFVITAPLTKKILTQMPSISPDKLVVAPSGANLSLLKPLPKIHCQRMQDLNPQKKYVGFVGTLLKHQGIDTLLRASDEILTHEPACVFIIIGEGPMKQPWMARVKKMSREENFRFSGQIDYHRLPEWINAMDVCVAPYSKNTGLRSPVKIFDYMACAKPIVASRIDGTTTEFENTGALMLVEPDNPADLASAIVDLLRDEKRAQEMGHKARALVESAFDRYAIARRVVEVATDLRQQRATLI